MYENRHVLIKAANKETAAITIKEKQNIAHLIIIDRLPEYKSARPLANIIHVREPKFNGLPILMRIMRINYFF